MPVIDEALPTVNLRTSLSEGHMRVVGVDPALLEGFGAFTLTSGEEIRLEDLRDNEVYITDRGPRSWTPWQATSYGSSWAAIP